MKQHQVSKLTTITRRDLTSGQQAVQSSHAAIDFIIDNNDLANNWHKTSNYLINLSVADISELERLSAKLHEYEIIHTNFYEPDLDNELTAISFLSSEKTIKITGNLPLMLKERKPVLY